MCSVRVRSLEQTDAVLAHCILVQQLKNSRIILERFLSLASILVAGCRPATRKGELPREALVLFNCTKAASEADMASLESLSNHRAAFAIRWMKQDARNDACRLRCFYGRKITLALLLTPLLAGLVLLLYWQSGLNGFPQFNIASPTQGVIQHDLGIRLHPEEYASRAPTTQRFTWILTKSLLSPDGVEKQVFQINGVYFSISVPLGLAIPHPKHSRLLKHTNRPVSWANN